MIEHAGDIRPFARRLHALGGHVEIESARRPHRLAKTVHSLPVRRAGYEVRLVVLALRRHEVLRIEYNVAVPVAVEPTVVAAGQDVRRTIRCRPAQVERDGAAVHAAVAGGDLSVSEEGDEQRLAGGRVAMHVQALAGQRLRGEQTVHSLEVERS